MLQREIRWDLLRFSTLYSFGMKVGKVIFRFGIKLEWRWDYSTKSHVSHFKMGQHAWKKSKVKPLGPDDSPLSMSNNSCSNSYGNMGNTRETFYASETSCRKCGVVFWIVNLHFVASSVSWTWKKLTNSYSLSACSATLFPYLPFEYLMWLWRLHWMINLWNNFVFFSPLWANIF